MEHSTHMLYDLLIRLGMYSPHIPILMLIAITTLRGFAMGWDYAISWLTVLPFELIAAGITINFWRSDLNIAIWITVFLVVLALIQVFGVRGYGEGKP